MRLAPGQGLGRSAPGARPQFLLRPLSLRLNRPDLDYTILREFMLVEQVSASHWDRVHKIQNAAFVAKDVRNCLRAAKRQIDIPLVIALFIRVAEDNENQGRFFQQFLHPRFGHLRLY